MKAVSTSPRRIPLGGLFIDDIEHTDPDATTPDPVAPTALVAPIAPATPDPAGASLVSPPEPMRGRKRRVWLWLTVALVVIVLSCGGFAGWVLVKWPHAHIVPDKTALGRVVLPDYAGRIAAADVRTPDGLVPIEQRGGALWPASPLAAGGQVTVEVTIRRPSWVAWLIGRTEQCSLAFVTPTTSMVDDWLHVPPGAPVKVSFDSAVSLIALDEAPAQALPSPQTDPSLGVNAAGAQSYGTMKVAAAARTWETLSEPVTVHWFTALSSPQVLVEPAPGTTITPTTSLTLTFSDPISSVLGTKQLKCSPTVGGQWKALDDHTMVFEPSGSGFALGAKVTLQFPTPVHLAGQSGTAVITSLAWQVPPASLLRLQQLFAQLGYLPLTWKPNGTATPTAPGDEADAAAAPPAGTFTWTYANTPASLQALWAEGKPNTIMRGAIMTFENTHHLAVDGLVGPAVWQAVLNDAVAGKQQTTGYSYVYVQRRLPQTLFLWHNGSVIFTSAANTGIAAAPTVSGTFPVFEHIPVGTMSGTNPDGTTYHDPGIRYISYFNGGDALHAFSRGSYGWPQSLGCVELPLSAAGRVWPYTPIGTLVTILP